VFLYSIALRREVTQIDIIPKILKNTSSITMKSFTKILFVAAAVASSSMVVAHDAPLSQENSVARQLGDGMSIIG
jgi:hypothetical protein